MCARRLARRDKELDRVARLAQYDFPELECAGRCRARLLATSALASALTDCAVTPEGEVAGVAAGRDLVLHLDHPVQPGQAATDAGHLHEVAGAQGGIADHL